MDNDYDNIYGGADDEVDYGMASPVAPKESPGAASTSQSSTQAAFQQQQKSIPSQSYNQVKHEPNDNHIARSLGAEGSLNAQSAILVHEMHWVSLFSLLCRIASAN